MPTKKVKNPFTLEKLQSTVINYILPEVLFFTTIASGVTMISKWHHNLSVEPQMLTVLGTILSLVISFRTSSAYDRYWEGRKLWGVFHTNCRNLAEIIWIHVPIEKKKKPEEAKPTPSPAPAAVPAPALATPAVPKGDHAATDSENTKENEASDSASMRTLTEGDQHPSTPVEHVLSEEEKNKLKEEEERRIERLKAIIEKKTMINIVEALAPALKHYLRDEPGIRYEDLYPLLSGLPHFATTEAGYRTDEDVSPLLHYDLWETRHPEEANWRPRSGVDRLDWTRRRSRNARGSRHAARAQTAPEVRDLEKGKTPDVSVETGLYFDDRHVGLEESKLKPARIPPPSQIYDLHPIIAFLKWLSQKVVRLFTIIKYRFKGEPVPVQISFLKEDPKPKDNIPLELCSVTLPIIIPGAHYCAKTSTQSAPSDLPSISGQVLLNS